MNTRQSLFVFLEMVMDSAFLICYYFIFILNWQDLILPYSYILWNSNICFRLCISLTPHTNEICRHGIQWLLQWVNPLLTARNVLSRFVNNLPFPLMFLAAIHVVIHILKCGYGPGEIEVLLINRTHECFKVFHLAFITHVNTMNLSLSDWNQYFVKC